MKYDIVNRRRKIVAYLDQGHRNIQELSHLIGVSAMTVRRDLAQLEKKGKVLRTFGGAIVRDKLAYEFAFHEKASKNKQAKELIGKIGASLVCPRDMVFIDTGTTALAVALALRGTRPCTIVTTNLCVASELVGQQDIRVLVPGGELSEHSPDLYGELTLKVLSDLQVDIAFLGCDAISPKEGFFASEIKVAAVSQLIMSRSRRRFLVADSSKFAGRSFCRIGPLTDLSGVITDNQLDNSLRQIITEMEVPIYQSIDNQKSLEQTQ